MFAIAIVILPAILVWGGIGLRYVSLTTLAAVFLVATACMPPEFFSSHAFGLGWTVDRLVLAAILVLMVLGWKQGRLSIRPLQTVDYLMGLFLIWLTARTITQPLGSVHPLQPHTLMHMINGYCVPFLLYFAMRSVRLDAQALRPAFWILTLMGVYLAATAIFEVGKVWSLVFPKFIADPTLGIHFGRARGPMLQSVRLGMCLLGCLSVLFVFTVWLRPAQKSRWILFAALAPVLMSAIAVTYTRSIWMGLIAIVGIVVLLVLQGPVRRGLIVGGVVMGLFGGLVLGPSLVAFKRETSAAETRESTYMRAAFAYVSLEMIKERPIAGYGFNQFNVVNLGFLSDRSTDIRLESIRGYVHHNSYLSLAVDLGIVGFSLFMLILAAFAREGWSVWRNLLIPDWARGLGLVAICLMSVHLIQMAFHEVSFSSIENTLLFGAFGLVMAVRRQFAADSAGAELPVRDLTTNAAELH